MSPQFYQNKKYSFSCVIFLLFFDCNWICKRLYFPIFCYSDKSLIYISIHICNSAWTFKENWISLICSNIPFLCVSSFCFLPIHFNVFYLLSSHSRRWTWTNAEQKTRLYKKTFPFLCNRTRKKCVIFNLVKTKQNKKYKNSFSFFCYFAEIINLISNLIKKKKAQFLLSIQSKNLKNFSFILKLTFSFGHVAKRKRNCNKCWFLIYYSFLFATCSLAVLVFPCFFCYRCLARIV